MYVQFTYCNDTLGDTPLELSEATNLPFTVCYFDNITVMISGLFEDHMEHLDQVLSQLQNKGSQVNGFKSFWAGTNSEYLGFCPYYQ
jgi:hypothetical protein